MKKKINKRPIKNYIRNALITSAIALFACISLDGFLVSAQERETSQETSRIYYRSIEIQSGDTLWGIAESTMTFQFDSVAEYVSFIKEINQLETDEIYSGQHLIIPYENVESAL